MRSHEGQRLLQDSGPFQDPPVAVQCQRRRGHPGAPAGQARRRPSTRAREALRRRRATSLEPAHLPERRHDVQAVSRTPTTSCRTIRSPPTSSSCSRRSSSRSARPGPRACTWPVANGRCSMPSSRRQGGGRLGGRRAGAAVPFYPSIESFLDTAVKRTIDQASDNASLEPFDIDVLQVLFLIRYVDEMKGNVDNLVTLCIDEIDADRLALGSRSRRACSGWRRRRSSAAAATTTSSSPTKSATSTGRSRRSISPAAKRPSCWASSSSTTCSRDQRKHRFTANKMDFAFNRLCDQHPVGNRVEGALVGLGHHAAGRRLRLATTTHEVHPRQQTGRWAGPRPASATTRASGGNSAPTSRPTSICGPRTTALCQRRRKRIHRDLAEDNRNGGSGSRTCSARSAGRGQLLRGRAASSRSRPRRRSARWTRRWNTSSSNTFTKMGYLQVLHATSR